MKNGKIYVGSTTQSPNSRLEEHNRGLNKFTSENKPFILVYYEEYMCKQDAIKRELFYKSGLGRKIRNAIINTTTVASAKGGSASG